LTRRLILRGCGKARVIFPLIEQLAKERGNENLGVVKKLENAIKDLDKEPIIKVLKGE